MSDNDMIRVDEVCRMLGGVSRSTIYNWTKQLHFPRGAHIGDRVVAWRRGQVKDWIDRKVKLAA